jgi:hypothetical protein
MCLFVCQCKTTIMMVVVVTVLMVLCGEDNDDAHDGDIRRGY